MPALQRSGPSGLKSHLGYGEPSWHSKTHKTIVSSVISVFKPCLTLTRFAHCHRRCHTLDYTISFELLSPRNIQDITSSQGRPRSPPDSGPDWLWVSRRNLHSHRVFRSWRRGLPLGACTNDLLSWKNWTGSMSPCPGAIHPGWIIPTTVDESNVRRIR